MRHIITILLTLISVNVFSQTSEIERLTETLRSYRSGEEHYGVKHGEAYKLLSLDKYNDVAVFYLLSSYQQTGHQDSIPLLFKYLIKQNPNDVEPYLIRERYEYYERPGYTARINNLKEALKINPEEEQVNYLLGKLYYELFVREYNKNRKKANLDHYSQSAIRYFTVVCDQNQLRKEMLSFPLLQLANYSGDVNKKKLYKTYNVQISYFPVSAFVDLPKGWETDYSVNVMKHSGADFNLSGVESAISSINWYSRFLFELDEPVLCDSLPAKVYRFIYLRTFDNPIVISLENNNDVITLYWKVSDGMGGYEPGKTIINETKTLTFDDWNAFENKIKELNFWNLPTVRRGGIRGTDGSQWILEGKYLGRYHVLDRWCGGEISSVCNELIKLTGLEIKDIY